MILNLTQHQASPDQIKVGVCDIPLTGEENEVRERLHELLTFEELPTAREIGARAEEICFIASLFAKKGEQVMIGGAPYLMGPLERNLRWHGFIPVYAFSKREVSEDPATGRKVSVFRHLGFIEAVPSPF